MSVGVVVGNPKPRSRTLDAAVVTARLLTGSEPDFTIDLADFGAGLLDWSDPGVAAAVAQVSGAELMVVASPTFKATYSGLLKLFIDRFAAGSLAGVVAVPLQLGAHWRHALAPEVFLKPLLSELGAATPTSALYLLDTDAVGGFDSSPTLLDWLDLARRNVAARPAFGSLARVGR